MYQLHRETFSVTFIPALLSDIVRVPTAHLHNKTGPTPPRSYLRNILSVLALGRWARSRPYSRSQARDAVQKHGADIDDVHRLASQHLALCLPDAVTVKHVLEQ